MADELFRSGVQAARDGDFAKAQAYFIQVVQANPNSEKGWLYLGHCLPDQPKREYCYRRVLKLNPANQEAEKALAALRPAAEAEADQAVSEQPVVAVQPGASSPGGKDASDPKGSSFRPVIVTAGAVGLLLLCISMFCVYAIFTSVAGQGGKSFPAMMLQFAASPTATDTPTLTVTPSPRPSITPSRTPRPTFTLIPTSSPIATFAPVGSILDNSVDITHWTQVITQDPKNADAYYQRANAYNSIRKVGSLDTVNATLDLALQDIDKAIALRPDQGNYYALRQSIYYNKGSSAQFEVDSEYLYHFALENAIKANQLGTTVQDPDRIIVIDLIAVNQCQAALDMLQQIMAVILRIGSARITAPLQLSGIVQRLFLFGCDRLPFIL